MMKPQHFMLKQFELELEPEPESELEPQSEP
eukprot:COSAG05_NODE_2011_length_3702_cov_3.111019_4_plen_31_part_00